MRGSDFPYNDYQLTTEYDSNKYVKYSDTAIIKPVVTNSTVVGVPSYNVLCGTSSFPSEPSYFRSMGPGYPEIRLDYFPEISFSTESTWNNDIEIEYTIGSTNYTTQVELCSYNITNIDNGSFIIVKLYPSDYEYASGIYINAAFQFDVGNTDKLIYESDYFDFNTSLYYLYSQNSPIEPGDSVTFNTNTDYENVGISNDIYEKGTDNLLSSCDYDITSTLTGFPIVTISISSNTQSVVDYIKQNYYNTTVPEATKQELYNCISIEIT